MTYAVDALPQSSQLPDTLATTLAELRDERSGARERGSTVVPHKGDIDVGEVASRLRVERRCGRTERLPFPPPAGGNPVADRCCAK
jgi:hypothetical protein